MADLSALSNEDLQAIAVGDLSRVSTEGLKTLTAGQPQGEAGIMAPVPTRAAAAQIPFDISHPIDSIGRLISQARDQRQAAYGDDMSAWLRDFNRTNVDASTARGLSDLVTGAGQTTANAIFGAYPNVTGAVNRFVAQNEADYQAARERQGRTLPDFPRAIGNTLGAAALGPLSPVGGSGDVAAALNGAIGGGALSLLAPVTNAGSGGFWSRKADQALAMGGTGAALGPAANIASRLLSPAVNADVKALTDAGVTPTPGQLIGPRAAMQESKASSLPVVGDAIRNAQRRAIESFDTAQINRNLAPIGETLSPGAVGRDAIDEGFRKISSAYDAALNRIGTVRVDPQFSSEVAKLRAMVDAGIGPQYAKNFDQVVADSVGNFVNPQGYMAARSFKDAESQIGSLARKAQRSPMIFDRGYGDALESLQESLRNMAQRSAPTPQLAQQVQDANLAWAMQLRSAKASAYSAANNGAFTPLQQLRAIKGDEADRNAFARGGGLDQSFAEAAQRVLGNTYPDSGTAGRGLLGLIAGGLAAHTIAPETTVPLLATGLAASAPYTSAGQRLATTLMTQRPEWASAAASLMQKAVPYSGLLGLSLAP